MEWAAVISSSKGSFWPRDWTWISCVSCIAGGFFTIWATREALKIWRRLRNSIAVIACKITLIWDALPPWVYACRYSSKFLGQWSLPKAGLSGCGRPLSRPCCAPRKATKNPGLPRKEVESGVLSSVSVSFSVTVYLSFFFKKPNQNHALHNTLSSRSGWSKCSGAYN